MELTFYQEDRVTTPKIKRNIKSLEKVIIILGKMENGGEDKINICWSREVFGEMTVKLRLLRTRRHYSCDKQGRVFRKREPHGQRS